MNYRKLERKNAHAMHDTPISDRKTVPVTIVMPVFNGSRFWGRAIRSIEEQTVLPERILLINDASTDDTLALMLAWQRLHPDLVEIIDNPRNMGVVASFELGIQRVTTEYFTTQAVDDYYFPSYIEKHHHLLSQHPQAAFSVSDMGVFQDDPYQHSFKCKGMVTESKLGYHGPVEMVDSFKLQGMNGLCMFRKTCFETVVGPRVEPRLRWHWDWFQNAVMAFRYGVCYVPEVLSAYYVSDTTFSGSRFKHMTDLHDTYACVLELIQSEKFSDLLGHFISSGILSHFGHYLADFVLQNPNLINPVVMALIQPNLLRRQEVIQNRKNRQPDWKKLEEDLPVLTSWVAASCEATGQRRIALYGAGLHTTYMVGYLRRYEAIRIVCLIETDVHVQGKQFAGIPIRSIQDAFEDVDAIVLSSILYEEAMMANCQRYHPQLPCYPIWSDRKKAVKQHLEKWFAHLIPILLSNASERILAYVDAVHMNEFKLMWKLCGGPDSVEVNPKQGIKFEGPVVVFGSEDMAPSELYKGCVYRIPVMQK